MSTNTPERPRWATSPWFWPALIGIEGALLLAVLYFAGRAFGAWS